MPTLLYNKALLGAHNGNIVLGVDSFKMMLVGAAYVENKDTHQYRSDVSSEISGTGYTAGGQAVAATLALDLTLDKLSVTFAAVVWTGATFTARKAVIYKSRGGGAGADELVLVRDFGVDLSPAGVPFTVNAIRVDFSNG
jgi:hypothetical protein